MTGTNPSQDGGGGSDRQLKRQLKPGRAQEASPAKMLSIIPLICHDRAGRNANAEVWGGNTSPATVSKSRYAESEDVTRDGETEACATGRSPESGLLGRGCPSSSWPMESGGVADLKIGNPTVDGGLAGGEQSSSRDGCGPSTTSRRRKRVHEPGEDKPAPVKRMSPASLRRHDGVSGGPNTAVRRVDSPPLHDSSESSSSYRDVLGNDTSSEGIVREDSPMSAPGNRRCLSPSLKRGSTKRENVDVGNDTVSPARGSPMTDKSSTEKPPGADCKGQSGSNVDFEFGNTVIGDDCDGGLSPAFGRAPPTASKSRYAESEDVTRGDVAEACATSRSPESGLLGRGCLSSSLPMESDGVVNFKIGNPTVDGGGRIGGDKSSSRDVFGPSTTSCRRKGAHEPGEEDKPAPVKRMSPASLRRHDGVSGGPDTAIWRADSPPLYDSSESSSSHREVWGNDTSSEGIVRENSPVSAPGNRSCLSLSLKRESTKSENVDVGDDSVSPARGSPMRDKSSTEKPPGADCKGKSGSNVDFEFGNTVIGGGVDGGLSPAFGRAPPTASKSRYAESEGVTRYDVAEACATGRSPESGLLGRGCLSSSLPMESGGVVDFEMGNPAVDGGGRTGGERSSSKDGCGPSITSRRRKRSREPGEEDKPASVKRMSPASLRRHDGVSGGPDTAVRRADSPPLCDSSESSSSHREVWGNDTSSEEIVMENWLMSAPSESTLSENGDVGNDTVSPARGSPMTDKSSTEKHPGADCKGESGSNNDSVALTPSVGSGEKLGLASREEPPPMTTISATPLRGRGSPTGVPQADASVTTDYTSYLFELESLPHETAPAMTSNTFPLDGSPMAAMGTPPGSFSSPLQQFLLDFSSEVSGNGGGGDCALPLPLTHLLAPPEASDGELSLTPHESLQGLVGGLQASSCWDGGCASRSPPGSGGGFSVLPTACLSPLFSGRGTSADSIASGRGEVTAHEVDGLGLLIPDVDIAECMATLQATPTDFGSQKTLVPPSSPPRDLCNDAGGCDNDDTGAHVEEEKEKSGGCDRGRFTTRIGDLFQAAIPDLAYREGVVDSPLTRAPPLQLWRPGIVPERALEVAFPSPRRQGAGSSDMEQKMTSAFLIARASGFERERCDGRGNGDAPLESLAEVAANGDGCAWRSDWPDQDKEAFRKGVYAFRRDFGRIRGSFLPHREVPELVEFFYRRWKMNPEYSVWKNTDQLIGRRVAQRPGPNETRQGVGLGKSFDDRGLRRGWVVGKKKVRGRKEKFVVRFPPDGSSQATFEKVSIGVLETMLVEGSATDEERASEALDGARVAQHRSEIATLSARACISPGHGAFSPATGSGGINAPSRPTSRVASGRGINSTID